MSDGAGESCPITLSGGSGSCSLTGSTPGARTLTAQYAGDSIYAAGSTTANHTVSSPTAAITFTSNTPNPSYVNQAYTIGVSLSGPLGTPTGTVAVSDGSGASCDIALSGGAGSCSLASTGHGAKTITAAYTGDTNYVSGSNTVAHQVNQRAPTVTITADTPDPSYVFQTYPVSVTVSGAGETPTGTVNVSDGSGATCAISLSSGAGNCNLASTTPGSKTLSAAYTGDTVYTSGSDTEPHTVNLYASSTAITGDSADPALVGEAYTVQVEVTSISPVSPSGTVTVSDGDGNNCSASLTGGSGSCALTSTSTGVKTLSASYPGDTRHLTSSDTESHTVNIAPTTASITAVTPDSVKVKQPFTVSFSVAANAPSTAIPNGDVTISDGEGNTCSGTLNASGQGSCALSASSTGTKTLTMNYSGNSNFLTSSDTDSVSVDKAATTISITSDLPDPSSSKAPYTIQVSAALVAPSVGVPETDVTVEDGTGNDCTATLVNGLGSCVFNTETTGTTTLQTSLAESANYLASSDTESHFIATLPDDISLSENRVSTAHTTVGQLSYNEGYPTYTYTLETSGSVCNGINGLGNNGFEINANPGNLTATLSRKITTPKGTYPICVMVTDALGASYQEAFTLKVNDPPSDLSLSDSTVAVDESQVGVFTTSDGLVPFTYSFATSGAECDTGNSSGNTQFTLAGSLLKTRSGITAGSHNICVQVSDFFNDTYQEAFTITVTDATQSDDYGFTLSSTALIDGDTPGTLLGTLQNNGGPRPTYALVDNGSYPDNQSFEILGVQVIFKGTADIAVQSGYVIKIQVTAPDSSTHTEEFHITVYGDGTTAGAVAGKSKYFVLSGDRLKFKPELSDIFSTGASQWAFYDLVKLPSHGTAKLGSIIYQSKSSYEGKENLSYRICDDAGYCLLVDVVITVEPLPMPETGFPPLTETILPAQTVEYTEQRLNLSIPKLDIDTEIIGVPYAADGWDLRWLGEKAGWLQGTAFPTWNGNSVITGHVVDSFGKSGLFSRLSELRYGDVIEINFLGRIYIYEVRSSEVYPADASQPLAHTPDGYDYLTLVTCKDYDEDSGQYHHRLAVQAVLRAIQ